MDGKSLARILVNDNRKSPPIFTVSILTYNRVETVLELLESLEPILEHSCEIVVVDNASSDGTCEAVRDRFPLVHLIALPKNVGVGARNRGIESAKGEIVITLDDDILGIDGESLAHLKHEFDKNARLGALCFQVKDHITGEVCNWCHPYSREEFFSEEFLTTEISEGAVALRKSVLEHVGGYSEDFFISHEGADLATRIIDYGYEVRYTPSITVQHKFAAGGRKNWRRYYYDTRNDFWLVIRNYRFCYGLKYILRRTTIMLVYALRDGFFRYWLKALFDVGRELPRIIAQRKPISRKTENRIREINGYRPGLRYYIERRIGQRKVRI